jgi:hypothetical protein
VSRRPSCKSLVLLIVMAVACRPNLEIRYGDGSVQLDVRSLGEYPDTVSKIRITEVASGRVVWEVKSDRPYPKIWNVTLRPGANESHFQSSSGWKYKTLEPNSGKTFKLFYGVDYRAEVWGNSSRAAVEYFKFIRNVSSGPQE